MFLDDALATLAWISPVTEPAMRNSTRRLLREMRVRKSQTEAERELMGEHAVCPQSRWLFWTSQVSQVLLIVPSSLCSHTAGAACNSYHSYQEVVLGYLMFSFLS